MAREAWEEVSFQVIHEMDGTIRSGWFPTGTGIVEGNVAVDYVWGGSFPLQPDDDRDGATESFGGGAGDQGWAATATYNSDTLQFTDYTVAFNNVGGTVKVPADSHTIVDDAWVNYPGFATIPSVVGTNYTLGETIAVLTPLSLNIGTVIRTAEFSINGEAKIVATAANAGQVVAQSPKAGDGLNSGGFVDLVILDPTPLVADVVVPDVVGELAADAQLAIEGAGLVYASTTTAVGATVENDGTVKSQTPAAGTVVNGGTTANVVLYAYVAP